jgi:hypothetical protein
VTYDITKAKITDDSGHVTQRPAKGAFGELPWWMLDRGDQRVVEQLSQTAEHLRKTQSARIGSYVYCLKLFDNVDAFPGNSGWDLSAVPRFVISNRITHNVIQEVVQSITAKHARSKPRPFYLTSGGTWKQRRKCKALNKFIDGIFFQTAAYKKGIHTFKSAAVFGTGVQKVYLRDGKVQHDHVLPINLFVDDVEALLQPPRTIYEYRECDRYALASEYPDHQEEILRASPVVHKGSVHHNKNQIPVWEAWHLPLKAEGTDGRHVIALADHLLLDEGWTRTRFPFAALHYDAPLLGYWGHGLAYSLLANQIKINKLLQTQDRQLSLSGRIKWIVSRMAKVQSEHLNNAPSSLEWSGVGPEPHPVMPPARSTDLNDDINDTIRRSFELTGASQLSATSQKPQGVNAAVALRTLGDLETERLLLPGQAYEQFYLDLAALDLDCVQVAVRSGGSYKVNLPRQRFVEEIDFKHLDFDEESYYAQCTSISSLPREPAGRLQMLTEWIQAGWVDQKRARELMDFPDLESCDSLELASREYIDKILDEMIDDAEYTAPEAGFDDTAYGYQAGLAAYNLARVDGVPEDRLDLLRQWIDACSQINTPPAPAVVPAPQPGSAGPQLARPEALPTSPLLPQGQPAPAPVAAQ